MEIIYYQKQDGHVPVEEYLEQQYEVLESDSKKVRNDKMKRLAKLEAVIKNAAQNGGVAGGMFSAPLNGYAFQELRIREGSQNRLVRILYFSYSRKKLILLNAYDKPDLYEKGGKKKIDKEINDVHRVTNQYYKDFLQNPNQYKKYE